MNIQNPAWEGIDQLLSDNPHPACHNHPVGLMGSQRFGNGLIQRFAAGELAVIQ